MDPSAAPRIGPPAPSPEAATTDRDPSGFGGARSGTGAVPGTLERACYPPPSNVIPSPWFPLPRIRSAAATVVYCLPCAGAAASIYRAWRESAPPRLEIVPVELPGRGRRFREAAFTEVAPLLAELAPQIERDAGERPTAVFGHSMGAVIAFELARALGPRVRRLFVSGSSAPHLRIVKERSSLSDEELKRELAE